MSKDIRSNLGELNDSLKEYVQIKIDLFKLSLLEKSTKFTSYLFVFRIVLKFAILIIGFAAATFAVWYGETHDDLVGGLLIATGALIVLALVFIIFRKQVVTNSILRNFSEILLEDEDNKN
ncbi:MAG: hypothetical protein WC987_05990 [Mariniphaga sp.]|jgi:hypothetical protein